jgi:pimeloyl-ACP methyl ester carboxylesterase/class 3 adenylate cyclase
VEPAIRFAKSDEVSIAYQVVGSGPLDLVWVPGWTSNLELMWEEPSYARLLLRLASFSRLILLDKRGTGLSDRVPTTELPTLEQRMDDVRAVMDHVGSERAALFGTSEGGPLCALFAATHPERTTALVMYGAYATLLGDADYPWGWTREVLEQGLQALELTWADAADTLSFWAPSVAGDPAARQWWSRFLRLSASPAAAIALARMNAEIDIRPILPAIHVPTLVLHREGDAFVNAGGSRYMASQIAGARYVDLPGVDHLPFWEHEEAILGEVEEFLTGVRPLPDPERILATVLFTDIVGSTEQAVAAGDRRWRDLLETHNSVVRRELRRFHGREVNTAGDGFLATFDGPARAIRCAQAIGVGVRTIGLQVRAGLHTGECEQVGDDIGGIAVHIGARVAAQAGPAEILVSSTVKDLVAGAGIAFADQGEHALKGVPGTWRLFAVMP